MSRTCRLTGELRGGSSENSDEGSDVDDGTSNIEAEFGLGFVLSTKSNSQLLLTSCQRRSSCTHVAHCDNGVFAPVPHALDVDGLCQVPDLLLGVDGVVVARAP